MPWWESKDGRPDILQRRQGFDAFARQRLRQEIEAKRAALPLTDAGIPITSPESHVGVSPCC